MFEQFPIEVLSLEFYVSLLDILAANILLAGELALVIAAVTQRFPPGQQRICIFLGSAFALGLRVAPAFGAAWLMPCPGVALIGGLILVKVGYDLVKPDGDDADVRKPSISLLGAVLTIGLVGAALGDETVMSIAAMADGSVPLMALGGMLSIPMVMAFSLTISWIVQIFPILKVAGVIFLASLAATMMAHDPLMAKMFGVDEDGAMFWTLLFASLSVLVSLTHFAWSMRWDRPAPAAGDGVLSPLI